jgi:hypothetical protein
LIGKRNHGTPGGCGNPSTSLWPVRTSAAKAHAPILESLRDTHPRATETGAGHDDELKECSTANGVSMIVAPPEVASSVKVYLRLQKKPVLPTRLGCRASKRVGGNHSASSLTLPHEFVCVSPASDYSSCDQYARNRSSRARRYDYNSGSNL